MSLSHRVSRGFLIWLAPEFACEFEGIVSRSGGGESPDINGHALSAPSPKIFSSRALLGFSCARKRLKVHLDFADAICMFLPISSEPCIRERAIAAFCAALNTPVVNIEDLETGPARAAILLTTDEYDDPVLLVRVSLISSGQGVTFCCQDDPAQFGGASGAIAAALGFAEGMGFLFDDDLIAEGGPSGPNRAWKIWSSLVSLDPDPPAIESGSSPTGREDDPTENPPLGRAVEYDEEMTPGASGLWNVEANANCDDSGGARAVELDLSDELVVVEAVDRSSQSETVVQLAPEFDQDPGAAHETSSFIEETPELEERSVLQGAPVLTKFRGGGARESADRRKLERRKAPGPVMPAAAAESLPSNSVELARTALVTREVGSEIENDRGYLTRLLSSF